MQKLLKVNHRLCEEEKEALDRPLNWFKALSSLYVQLYDIRLTQSFGLKGNSNLNLTDDVKDRLELKRFLQNLKSDDTDCSNTYVEAVEKSILEKVYTEGKEKYSKRSIRATAVLIDRSINLLKDGETTGYAEHFKATDFVCYEGEGLGSLIHTDDENGLKYDRNRSEPYLSIETYLPKELFERLWDRLEGNDFSEVSAYVQVDVFQSEMERSLTDPWMHQTYTIESGSYDNYCSLEWICIDGKRKLIQPHNTEPLESNVEDDSQDYSPKKNEEEKSVILQQAFLSEIKRTNKLVKWLVISVFLLGFFVLRAGG